MEARFAALAAKFGCRSSLLAFLLTVFIKMVSLSIQLNLLMDKKSRKMNLLSRNLLITRSVGPSNIRPKNPESNDVSLFTFCIS